MLSPTDNSSHIEQVLGYSESEHVVESIALV